MTSAALTTRTIPLQFTLIRDAVAEHAVLLVVFVLQLAVSAALCAAAHMPFLLDLGDAFFTIDSAVFIFGAMALAAALVRARPSDLPFVRAYALAWRDVRDRVMSRRWVASVGALLIVLPISLALFSAAKQAIPSIVPFSWDDTLERMSRELHGGRNAWEWLQPMVGRPAITIALDRYYHIGWSLLALGTLGLVVVSPVSRLRRQFLAAWVTLSFACGTLAALAFSSAGPPYLARITGEPDPYFKLRIYLRSVDASVPLLSVGGRRALWMAYTHRLDSFGFGISAMPSMHIATTALVACLASAISPVLGITATTATFLMLVGSVALFWHYAIDGYVGALMAIAIWYAIGAVEKRRRIE